MTLCSQSNVQKKDLGPCPKLHSEPLKLEYETARKTKDFGFERELLRKLEEMVRDCDREVERQARRLKEEEDLKLENDPISRQIQDLQEQAERLGEEGKLDEYMVISAQIEQLKDKRNETQGIFVDCNCLTLLKHKSLNLLDKLRKEGNNSRSSKSARFVDASFQSSTRTLDSLTTSVENYTPDFKLFEKKLRS